MFFLFSAAITAQIQVLIASNGGDTTIPLEMLKAILPQPPTIDQIAAGDCKLIY